MSGHTIVDGKCSDCGKSASTDSYEPGWADTGKETSSSNSCFIATAVYGDTLAPEVVSLRAFRDDVLKKTWWGRAFITAYYKVSPPIAEGLKKTPRIAAIIRAMLDRLVQRIKK